MNKPRRPRKSTKKRGAFKITPKRVKARSRIRAEDLSQTAPLVEPDDFMNDEPFNRV